MRMSVLNLRFRRIAAPTIREGVNASLRPRRESLAPFRLIFGWYEKNLRDVKGIELNYGAPETHNVYWMVTAVLDPRIGLKKEELMRLMDEQHIDCRPFFFPLSSIPAYYETEQARLALARNRNAYRVTPYGINLPSGLNLTEDNVAFVCGILKAALEERTKPSTLAVV